MSVRLTPEYDSLVSALGALYKYQRILRFKGYGESEQDFNVNAWIHIQNNHEEIYSKIRNLANSDIEMSLRRSKRTFDEFRDGDSDLGLKEIIENAADDMMMQNDIVLSVVSDYLSNLVEDPNVPNDEKNIVHTFYKDLHKLFNIFMEDFKASTEHYTNVRNQNLDDILDGLKTGKKRVGVSQIQRLIRNGPTMDVYIKSWRLGRPYAHVMGKDRDWDGQQIFGGFSGLSNMLSVAINDWLIDGQGDLNKIGIDPTGFEYETGCQVDGKTLNTIAYVMYRDFVHGKQMFANSFDQAVRAIHMATVRGLYRLCGGDNVELETVLNGGTGKTDLSVIGSGLMDSTDFYVEFYTPKVDAHAVEGMYDLCVSDLTHLVWAEDGNITNR